MHFEKQLQVECPQHHGLKSFLYKLPVVVGHPPQAIAYVFRCVDAGQFCGKECTIDMTNLGQS